MRVEQPFTILHYAIFTNFLLPWPGSALQHRQIHFRARRITVQSFDGAASDCTAGTKAMQGDETVSLTRSLVRRQRDQQPR